MPTGVQDIRGHHLHRKYSHLLCVGGDSKNLFFDGGAHFFGEQVRLFERFPCCGSVLRGIDRNLPERACRNSCLVGKARMQGYRLNYIASCD